MTKPKIPKDAITWLCGRCERWNVIEDGMCTKCGAPQVDAAASFREVNKLTLEEQNFYTNSVPEIINLLRNISKQLDQLITRGQ